MRRTNSGFFENVNEGRIIVIKVGTSSLLNPDTGTLRLSTVAKLCEVVIELHKRGDRVVLVTSGAVGVGCQQLKLATRPTKMAQKQALAAIGQIHLMRYYDELFGAVGLRCAQILLANDTFVHRHQYLNARATFLELFSFGVVPIVNENDTVAVEELRIGDNDTLAAKVAVMCEADWLFMLTDVPCLYTANPRDDPMAKPIHEVEDIFKLSVDTATRGTQWGTGGMGTKLAAAKIVTAAGSKAVVCKADDPSIVLKVMVGETVGTVFCSSRSLKGRKRWILSVPVKGALWMDDGAVKAVHKKRKSLFAAGITKVEGEFQNLDSVSLCDKKGVEFGRGLVNYNSEEIEKVMGMSSDSFSHELDGYSADEMVDRVNICLLAGDEELSEDGG